VNLYFYVSNNPVNMVDPMGTEEFSWKALGEHIWKEVVTDPVEFLYLDRIDLVESGKFAAGEVAGVAKMGWEMGTVKQVGNLYDMLNSDTSPDVKLADLAPISSDRVFGAMERGVESSAHGNSFAGGVETAPAVVEIGLGAEMLSSPGSLPSGGSRKLNLVVREANSSAPIGFSSVEEYQAAWASMVKEEITPVGFRSVREYQSAWAKMATEEAAKDLGGRLRAIDPTAEGFRTFGAGAFREGDTIRMKFSYTVDRPVPASWIEGRGTMLPFVGEHAEVQLLRASSAESQLIWVGASRAACRKCQFVLDQAGVSLSTERRILDPLRKEPRVVKR